MRLIPSVDAIPNPPIETMPPNQDIGAAGIPAPPVIPNMTNRAGPNVSAPPIQTLSDQQEFPHLQKSLISGNAGDGGLLNHLKTLFQSKEADNMSRFK